MNGSAPNCSAIGSHTRVTKKSSPNLCLGNTEPCHNSKISNSVTNTTEAANRNVTNRAISSPSRSRLRNEREPGIGPALGTVVVAAIVSVTAALLNLAQRLFFLDDHFLGQLRVRQRWSVLLPAGHHPFKETFDRVAFCPIRKFLRYQ